VSNLALKGLLERISAQEAPIACKLHRTVSAWSDGRGREAGCVRHVDVLSQWPRSPETAAIPHNFEDVFL